MKPFTMQFDVDWDTPLRDRISQALADEFNDEKARYAVDTLLHVIDPEPKTPRIEAGTKVVLPDGQVREIRTVTYDLDDAPSPSPIGLSLTFTERWAPRVG